jgi:hypothetical protein
VPDLLGANPGRFQAVIPSDQLTDAVEHYGKTVQKMAQPTAPLSHIVKVIRVNGNKNFTDISNEIGVSAGDVDRSKVQWSGMHLTMHYDIQHNGKPWEDAK